MALKKYAEAVGPLEAFLAANPGGASLGGTITVTAVNVSRASGAANPPLTAKLSGFVLGQTLATSGVTGSASCTTTCAGRSVQLANW